MISNFKLIFLIVFLFVCTKAFNQTADISDGCAPLEVQFNPPAGASSFFWDFKDGATSNLAAPKNTFLNPGTYIVEFKNSPTGAVVGTVTIEVIPKPDLRLAVDQSKGCAPHTVVFTDSTKLSPSVNVLNYSWVFSDGGTAFGNNTAYTFFNSGNFWVSMSINTNLPSCNTTKQFNNFINVSTPPAVNFVTNPNPPTKCTEPLTVQFTNTSSSIHPLSYEWDFDNTQTSTAENPPDQVFNLGDYDVELTATDTNLCSRSFQRRVSVGSPTSEFSMPDTACFGDTIRMMNTSSAGFYSWNFGDSARKLPNTSDFSPEIELTGSGLQTFQMTVSAGGCTGTSTESIFIERLNAHFTSLPDYSCDYPATIDFKSSSARSDLDYNWTFGNDSTSKAKDTMLVYENPDVSPYSINGVRLFETNLILTSPFGCTAEFSNTDTIWAPNALYMPDKVDGCVPLDVTFHDSSTADPRYPLVEWRWEFGDGAFSVESTDDPVTHTYTQIGEYDAYLIVTNSLGCIDTSYSVRIKVGDKINLDFSVNKTVLCIGDTVQFTDITSDILKDSIDAWHYYSESDRTFSCFQEKNPFWTFKSEPGFHGVNFTAGFNGCYSSVTRDSIFEVKGAVARLDFLIDCQKPFEVSFRDSSLSGNLSEIQFGDGNSAQITGDSTYTYTTEGKYEVILGVSDQTTTCATTYDTVEVDIRTIKAKFTSDSILCQNVPYTFDASVSDNVNSSCVSGNSKSPFVWTFSDTNMRPVSTDASSKSFSFEQRGLNKITLVATNVNGCSDTLTRAVRVYGVDAKFSLDDTSICNPSTINFTQLSTADTSIMRWRWDFGDTTGYLDSIPKDTSHRYTNFIPDMSVVLYITDSIGCADTVFNTVTMYKPAADINRLFIDTTLCLGDEVTFNASDFTSEGSSLDFNWDFMDGATSQQQNPQHQFNQAGIFNVRLNTTEKSSGCPDTNYIEVEVKNIPVAGYFTSGDTIKTICPNENILFTDTSLNFNTNLRYQWDFGNGRTSTFKNPGTVFIDNQTYTVTQIVTMAAPFGCADTNVRDFFVRGPKGDFFTDLNGDTICRLESVKFSLKDTADLDNYTWDFGDGTSLTNVDKVSHQYTFVPPSGRTVAKLILTNSDGSCPVTRDTIIPVFEVVADFQRNNGIDTSICFAPYPITNFSTNANEWYWEFGDGQISNDENPLVINYDNPGTYEVLLGVRNRSLGCTDTIVKSVTLFPIPDPMVVGDTICEGQFANVFVSNPKLDWTYQWFSSPDTAANNSTTANTSTRPLITSTYTVSVVDANGCSEENSTLVAVFNPLGLTDFDTTIIVGDKVVLPVVGDPNLYTFKWDPEEGLSCTDCLPPWVQPLDDITYKIEITDVLSCFTENATYNIIVRPETFISMPTTFTPNGDGINDILYLQGWGIKEVLEFKIFNRWGEIVFETTDLQEGWDGHHQGVLQNNDTYVYQVRVLTWREEEKAQEGYINLAR